MIITDQFVMLNLPKTGSTFARTAIKLIYKDRFDKLPFGRKLAIRLKLAKPLLQERLMAISKELRRSQHGAFSQIPAKFKQRDVFSIVRNPYDRLLSAYEYRWWVKHPPIPKELIAEFFPKFPELSLNEYIELSRKRVSHELGYRSQHARIGPQSIQFVKMFFKSPKKVLHNITDDYIDSNEYLNDIADVTFLRQEYLREDMKRFLEKYNFSEDELRLIDELGIVNETKNKSKNRNELFTTNAINYVTVEERFILKILSQKGLEYRCPSINELNVS